MLNDFDLLRLAKSCNRSALPGGLQTGVGPMTYCSHPRGSDHQVCLGCPGTHDRRVVAPSVVPFPWSRSCCRCCRCFGQGKTLRHLLSEAFGSHRTRLPSPDRSYPLVARRSTIPFTLALILLCAGRIGSDTVRPVQYGNMRPRDAVTLPTRG